MSTWSSFRALGRPDRPQEASSGRKQRQRQVYADDLTQLEAQAVFVDQAETCLSLADTHLTNLACRSDGRTLDASASAMVVSLNLMRMSTRSMKMKRDPDGLNAAKSLVQKFVRSSRVKYRDVPEPIKNKIDGVASSVSAYLLAVLRGDDTPILEISALEDPSDSTNVDVATTAMRGVLGGTHEVSDLRRDVRQNPERYRQKVANEARDWNGWDGEDARFDTRSKAILQEDMARVAPLVDPRVSEREARRALKLLVEGDRARQRHEAAALTRIGVDANGVPDLGGGSDCEMPDAHQHGARS